MKQVNMLSPMDDAGTPLGQSLVRCIFTVNYSSLVKLITVINERRRTPLHSSVLQSGAGV